MNVVSSTGHKRYGQPALSAQLPQPWLPAKKLPEPSTGMGVIIDVRRRWHEVKGFTLRLGAEARQRFGPHRTGDSTPDDQNRKSSTRRCFQRRSFEDESTRAWRQATNGDAIDEDGRTRIGGVIALSDDEDAEQEEANNTSYPVYFHRPDRRARSRSVSLSFATEPTAPDQPSLLD